MKGEGKVIFFTKLLGGVEELEAGTFRSYHGMFYCTCQNIPFYEFYLSRNAFKLRAFTDQISSKSVLEVSHREH